MSKYCELENYGKSSILNNSTTTDDQLMQLDRFGRTPEMVWFRWHLTLNLTWTLILRVESCFVLLQYFSCDVRSGSVHVFAPNFV